MKLCYVTINVSDLERSQQFYETICGFAPSVRYEPTRWQAYLLEDGSGGFAIIEQKEPRAFPCGYMVDFFVEDVERLWNRLRRVATVVSPLERTAWGSYKFVIEDPDKNQLGFVQQ